MRWPLSTVTVVGGLGALLVVGVLVTVLAVRQPETTYRAGSPEAAVATYLRLLQEGRVDQAYALISPPDFSNYGNTMDRSAFHQEFDHWSQTSRRVTLVTTVVDGASASVTVDITQFSGSPLGAADQTNRQTITLVRKTGRWLVTGPAWLN